MSEQVDDTAAGSIQNKSHAFPIHGYRALRWDKDWEIEFAFLDQKPR